METPATKTLTGMAFGAHRACFAQYDNLGSRAVDGWRASVKWAAH
jgi:hypothetical protein